jgi:hypothetical protein
MAGSFTASVKNWSEKAIRNAELVFKQSVQDLFELANRPVAKGGRMRVDTGFLRNSLTMELNGTTFLGSADSYVLAVANLNLGDSIFGGWTANYAIPREFGARGQSPDFFARGAAMEWVSIVGANAAKLR